MKTNRISVAAGLAALAIFGVAAGTGMASASGPAAANKVSPQSATAESTTTTSTVVACNGGRNLSLRTRMSAVPFSFPGTTNALVTIPGAGVTLRGPATGTDTLLITYSAETYYKGSGWMGIQVHKDGVPIQPYANNGNPYAINSSATYQGNSAQFCTKIGKGLHTIRVKAYTTGGVGESGWFDDWTLSVLRFS
jgi:hypothetical protein